MIRGVPGLRHCLLTDFGLSKELPLTDRSHSFCGSSAYLSPEMLKREGHGHSVDVRRDAGGSTPTADPGLG